MGFYDVHANADADNVCANGLRGCGDGETDGDSKTVSGAFMLIFTLIDKGAEGGCAVPPKNTATLDAMTAGIFIGILAGAVGGGIVDIVYVFSPLSILV